MVVRRTRPAAHPAPRRRARQHATLATAPLLRSPLPPLADQATLFLRHLASMPQDALDVAWT